VTPRSPSLIGLTDAATARRGDENGRAVVDILLAEGALTHREKAFLSTLRRSSTHLSRTASRTINRFDCLATRVVPRGPSGGPEMEGGVIHMPKMFTEGLLAELQGRSYRRSSPPTSAQYASANPGGRSWALPARHRLRAPIAQVSTSAKPNVAVVSEASSFSHPTRT